MNHPIQPFLVIAGAVHFCVLIASALTPGALDWKRNLALLHPFLRRLFWVYGTFIVLVILGFGSITLGNSRELAGGSPLARAFCGLVMCFWFGRLMVQWLVFDARPFLTNSFYKIGYHTLTLAFAFLAVIYGIAAWK